MAREDYTRHLYPFMRIDVAGVDKCAIELMIFAEHSVLVQKVGSLNFMRPKCIASVFT